MFNLEEYLEKEFNEGKIDFLFRAHIWQATELQKQVEIYIHPMGRNGMTSPQLVVKGNTLSEKEWHR